MGIVACGHNGAPAVSGGDGVKLNKAVFKYVENELYNLDTMRATIEQLRSDIISATPNREVVGGRSGVSDPTARAATKLVLSQAITRITRNIQAIEKSFSLLNDDHRMLYELKYRQRLSWQMVCQEMPTSERNYFKLRKELVMMVALEMGHIESVQ